MNFVLFPHFPSNNKLKPLIPKFHNLKTTITHLNYKGQLRFPTTLAKKNKYQIPKQSKYQNHSMQKHSIKPKAKNFYRCMFLSFVTSVCFSPLTASRTHQLRVPPACEREEAYTRNRVYFLTSMGFFLFIEYQKCCSSSWFNGTSICLSDFCILLKFLSQGFKFLHISHFDIVFINFVICFSCL